MLADLLDLLLPTECAGCALPGTTLCAGCVEVLHGPVRDCWPSPVPAGLPVGRCSGDYAGALRALLIAYKEHGRSGLAGPLAGALGRALPEQPRRLRLVPIPSRPAARRERGGDHVLLLARRAAALRRRTGRPTAVLPVLGHTGVARDSAGLSSTDLASNAGGAFRALASAPCTLAGGDRTPVWLIDDLVTTGATLAAATAVLRAAGWAVGGYAVVAATARRTVELGSP